MTKAADAAVLARYGFRDPQAALRELPPDWHDDGAWTLLLSLMGDVADPDAGLRRLHRLGGPVVRRARDVPERSRRLLAVVGFSDYLTDLLARTPGLAFELLGDPVANRHDLREFRDARLMHIAASDVSTQPSRASFEATTHALTALADECVQRELGDAGSDLAVMAMGKYGGDELNYVSDIDVLFVLGAGDAEAAERTARDLMRVMNGPPVIFRVDADLRPEGRDGPLVRTLDAYHAYYERWAQVWEFQSLIKCRFAAGSSEVGARFDTLIQPIVWPETLAPESIEQIRALKARAERETARGGRAPREVKLGPGGIRDVEFAVQLLQLVHGRHHPQLRRRSTLDALDVLGAEGYVGDEDVRELADAYVFLRHVEHRLQLEGGRQTHTLPAARAKREHLARSLRFRDGPDGSALEAFEHVWTRTTNVVRTIHERLFYRPLLETYAAAPSVRPAMSDREVDERLAVIGFDRPPRVREAIGALTSGGSRRAKLMRAIMPGVLAWMAETPEPDAGMQRLVDVASSLDGMPHLLAILRDEPPVVELMCRALGTGPVLSSLLQHDPALVTALTTQTSGEQDARTRAIAIVRRSPESGAALTALRRFKEGEVLRLATQDLAAGEDPKVFVDLAADLSEVGDASLEAALDIARREQAGRTGGPPPGAFAIVGMGRLGGREMSYASDLDVMFVYERDATCPDGSDARLFHSAVAEQVASMLSATPPIFRVDAEIRPEGRNGPIVRSLESYLVYYERWASLWEFQALIRARHAAGDRPLTARLIDAVAPKVWRPALSREDVIEIRHMKARIERERVKAREDRRTQVKLGVGGLADVEFTVQLLQLQHGRVHPELRTSNTLKAVGALEDASLIDPRDAAWLRDAYLLLNRVRNHMYLLRGLATDALPNHDEDLEKLARSLGYGRLARSRFLERYMRVTRRARRVTDRLFYGEQ